jgi:hypothetical protein
MADEIEPVPLHIILDPDGNPWGPFNDATKAWDWAEAKWPGRDITREDGGWDLVALRWPD